MLPPSQFITAFEVAGWTSMRHVKVHDDVPLNHPAHKLLASFGGLHINPLCDRGAECGTSDIMFQYVEHRFECVDEWEKRLAVELCGVALASRTYMQVWLAADGRVFGSNDITDQFCFVGATIDNAIFNLLSGVRVRPLLPPGQTETMMYGDKVQLGDPRLYAWN